MLIFYSIILSLTVVMLSTTANAWEKPPVLMGPGGMVPLLLQCFEGNGSPCSIFEAVAAAYRDKDTDSRLAGSHEILTNQLDDEFDAGIISVYVKDGKVDKEDFGSVTGFTELDDGYGEPIKDDDYHYDGDPTNHFLIYCCFSKQFNEEVNTNEEVRALGSGSMIFRSSLAAVATTAAMMFI
jgi:hypothetical protein